MTSPSGQIYSKSGKQNDSLRVSGEEKCVYFIHESQDSNWDAGGLRRALFMNEPWMYIDSRPDAGPTLYKCYINVLCLLAGNSRDTILNTMSLSLSLSLSLSHFTLTCFTSLCCIGVTVGT